MIQRLKDIKRDAYEFIVNDAKENVEGLNITIDNMFCCAIKEIDSEVTKRLLIELYAKARFHASSCESIINTFVIDKYS